MEKILQDARTHGSVRRPKGAVLLKVLETLACRAVDAGVLFAAFAIAGYGASPGRIAYVRERLEREMRVLAEEYEAERELLVRFRKMTYQLRRDGLIVGKSVGARKGFAITKRGLEKLSALSVYMRLNHTTPSVVVYRSEPAAGVTIITFDVPEKERWKRDWLRAVLRRLGFKPVQQSVWVGKVKVPIEFLKDLKALHLVRCVEIFQITKSGTLEQLS